jgi:hypothetical protein
MERTITAQIERVENGYIVRFAPNSAYEQVVVFLTLQEALACISDGFKSN